MVSSLPPAGAASQPSMPPPSPGDLEAVREIIRLLSKTVRAARIYSRNNEIYQRFWADLVKRMEQHLAARGTISLQVGPHELLMGGEVVYKPRADEDNFAFRLYKDGLRELEFARGMSEAELERFMGILSTDFDRGEYVDRDVVSLIWEADFKHIQTLSVDTFAQEAAPEDDDEVAHEEETMLQDLEAEQLESFLKQSAEVHLLKLDAEERREYHQVTAGLAGFEERNALHHGLIFEVASEERELLNAEAEELFTEEIPNSAVAEILFELYRQETPADYQELVDVTLGLLEPQLAAGDLETVVALLAPVRLLAMPDYARAFIHHDRVHQLFVQLGKQRRLELLTPAVNNGQLTGGPGALFNFVALLVPDSAPDVLAWIEQLTDEVHRRAAVDGLVSVMGGDFDPFRKAVRSANARLVADVIHGMGRLGDLQSLEVVLGASSHPDPRVRQEVLVALRSFESPRAREIILTALEDPVEDVRLSALRYVAVHRDKLAARQLGEQINSKAFRSRSFAEKRAVFMALAHIHGKDCLPLLTGFFHQKRQGELQRAAAHGLAVVGGVEARRLLEVAAREGSPELAAECRQVLSAMK